MIGSRIVRHFTTAAVALNMVVLCSAVRAQDLEPRAYSNSPVGLNFLVAGYGYAKGSVLTDPALPLDNVTNDAHVGVVAFARTPRRARQVGKVRHLSAVRLIVCGRPRLRHAARTLRHRLRRPGVPIFDELRRCARADGGGVQGLPPRSDPWREPAHYRAARAIRRHETREYRQQSLVAETRDRLLESVRTMDRRGCARCYSIHEQWRFLRWSGM